MSSRGMIDRSLSGRHLEAAPSDVAEAFPGRWLGLVGSMWLLGCSGNSYNFAIYSSSLKEMLGLTQEQLATLGVAKDVGDNVGLLAGLLGDILPSTAVISIGLVMNLVGYGLLGLMIKSNGWGASYWSVWVLLCVATNGASFFITAGLVTAQRNFPQSGGIVAGIVVGFIGLSGAIFAQIYATFIAPDVGTFLLMLAVVPGAVSLLCCFIVRPYPPPLMSAEKTIEEHTNLRTMMRCCLSLAAFLLLSICMQALLPDAHSVSLLSTCGMLLLLLLPALLFLPSATSAQKGPSKPLLSQASSEEEALPSIAEEEGSLHAGTLVHANQIGVIPTPAAGGHSPRLAAVGPDKAAVFGSPIPMMDESQPLDHASRPPPIRTRLSLSPRGTREVSGPSSPHFWGRMSLPRGDSTERQGVGTATPPASPVGAVRGALSKLGRGLSFMARGLGESGQVAEVLQESLVPDSISSAAVRRSVLRSHSLHTTLGARPHWTQTDTSSFSQRLLRRRLAQSQPHSLHIQCASSSPSIPPHLHGPLAAASVTVQEAAAAALQIADADTLAREQSVPDLSDPEHGETHHPTDGVECGVGWGSYFGDHGADGMASEVSRKGALHALSEVQEGDREGGHGRGSPPHKSIFFASRSDTESAPGSGYASPHGLGHTSPLRQPLLGGGAFSAEHTGSMSGVSGEAAPMDGAARAGGKGKGPELGEDHTFAQALSTLDFWLMYLGLVVGYGCGLAAISNLAQIGESLGAGGDVQVFTSVLSVCQFLGRLASGSVSEYLTRKYGVPRPLVLACVQSTTVIGLLAFAFAVPGCLYIGSLLVGFSYGGICSLMPVTAGELFGLSSLGMLYNMFLTATPAGSFLLSGILVGKMYEWEARRFPAPSSPPQISSILGSPPTEANATGVFIGRLVAEIMQGQGGNKLVFQGGDAQVLEVVTCYGAHCFRLVFMILSVLCVLGSLFHVVVAIRTRSLYAKLKIDHVETDPPNLPHKEHSLKH